MNENRKPGVSDEKSGRGLNSSQKSCLEHSFETLKIYNEKPEVSISPNASAGTNCQAYRDIVWLGKSALPFLRGKIGEAPNWQILEAIYEILDHEGESIDVPENIREKLRPMEKFTAKFLDDYLAKHKA